MTHARDVGLREVGDKAIGDWARTKGYAVITTDSDLIAMSEELGGPPKVVHIEECDFPLRVIEELLRRRAVRITEFDKDEASGVISLRIPQRRESR